MRSDREKGYRAALAERGIRGRPEVDHRPG
jgi:DNA-binding LacI/PurR family transcriptional regulator